MPTALQQLLSTASVACLATTLTVADAAGAWMRLLPAGTFTLRDGRGPYVAGDQEAMQKIVETSRQLAGATELAIDYDHQTQFGARDGVGGTAPAAGWIKELEVRDDGIYGRVEWTEKAAAAIKANEYRYLSPVFLSDKKGRVLLLQMAGLTNTPALDLMAVAASFSTRETDMDKIAAALGLAGGSGEDAILAALNIQLTASTAIAKAAGLADDAKPADVLAAVAAAFADRGKVAVAAGLAVTATADQIVAAFSAGGRVDPTKFVPIEQVQQLTAAVKALQDGQLTDKAEQAVASAIKDGKLVPALKQWGLDLYKADPAKFATFCSSAPVLTAPQLKTPAAPPSAGGRLDGADMAVCQAMGLDPAKFGETAKSIGDN